MELEDDDIKECEHCGTEIEGTDYLTVNEMVYCHDCAALCVNCETVELLEDLVSTDYGDLVCGDCRWSCYRCDSYYSEGDDSFTVNDDETWCRGCYENFTFYCNYCEESYSDGNDSYYLEHDDETWCSDCYSSHGAYCEDCEDYYSSERGCTRCGTGGSTTIRHRCCNARGVHNYSCKPPVQFKGSDKHNLFMGIELETEIRDSGNVYDMAVEYSTSMLDGVAILKHDSSIGRDGYNGFEIVTQPHSHTEYRHNSSALWETIDKLRHDYSARSWDTKTCGLHIHVSRAGFNGGSHMHRFLAFVYHNSEPLMKFAGRKTDFARFNDVFKFDEYDKPRYSFAHKLDRRQHSERYSAVNTQNRETLELRFFRGTLNPTGVLACIDLTHAMVEYTRDLRVSDVRLGALQWDWFVDFVQANNGIYPDLYDRLPKIATVNINKPELANA